MRCKLLQTLFLLFFIQIICVGQSTERFIRIVGNAVQEVESEGVKLVVAVSEVQPNEYRKIPYRKFEETYQEFVKKLSSMGIAESDLTKSAKTAMKYNKIFTKNYVLKIKDKNIVDKISEISTLEGITISEMTYIYLDNPALDEKLALSAIDDAKRKAKNICKSLGMGLGKILNIEDTSSGSMNTRTSVKEPVNTKNYRVNVTFELNDGK